jgi:hypothetical protein
MKAIETLKNRIEEANTATVEGRQQVANACNELYNTIKADVYSAGCEWMLNGMYNDLCDGNFSEPFICEKKKETFDTIVEVYNNRILPRL